jgi:hypothetical protein
MVLSSSLLLLKVMFVFPVPPYIYFLPFKFTLFCAMVSDFSPKPELFNNAKSGMVQSNMYKGNTFEGGPMTRNNSNCL